MSIKKCLSYVYFILLALPLLLLLLAVFRSGDITIVSTEVDLLNTITFTPLYNAVVGALDVFDITLSGFLDLVVRYFSYVVLFLVIHLIISFFTFLLTLFDGRSKGV